MTDPDAIAREIVSRHFEGNDSPETMEIADALTADISDTFRAYAAARVAEAVAAETERCARIADALGDNNKNDRATKIRLRQNQQDRQNNAPNHAGVSSPTDAANVAT